MKNKTTDFRERWMEPAAGWFLTLLMLLLPFKFGSLAALAEATSYFPDSFLGYLVVSWPSPALGLAGGAALLLAAAAFRPGTALFRTAAGWTGLWWGVALAAVSFLGWIAAATLDYAVAETGHLFGIGATVLAAAFAVTARPQWRGRFLAALGAGTLLLALSGLYQYFFGFAEMRAFLQQQLAAGVPISPVLQLKILDDRVYATFVSCNALAGYLLLLIPLTMALMWRWGNRFEPVVLSRRLLAAAGLLLPAAVLLLTRSRAAFLAALLVAGAFGLTLPMRRLVRVSLIAGTVLVIIAGAFYIEHRGRGFGSLEERADYLQTSARMVAEKPLFGYGWGGFFYRHMELKTTDTNESAHDPHNLVASFATQTGVAGALVVIVAFALPLWKLGRRIFRRNSGEPWTNRAIFWGVLAMLLHSFADIDLQIPATMAAAGVLLVCAIGAPETTPEAARGRNWPGVVPALLVSFGALGFGWHLWLAEYRYDQLLSLVRPQEETARPPLPSEVRDALAKAVAVRPYSPFPWESAGDYFFAIGELDEAERLFRESQRRTSERAANCRRLFELARKRGDLAAAREQLRRMLRLFPSNPDYQKLVQEFEAAEGDAPLRSPAGGVR